MMIEEIISIKCGAVIVSLKKQFYFILFFWPLVSQFYFVIHKNLVDHLYKFNLVKSLFAIY